MQGSEPLVAWAVTEIRNQPRWVGFVQPSPITNLEDYIELTEDAPLLTQEEIEALAEANTVTSAASETESTENVPGESNSEAEQAPEEPSVPEESSLEESIPEESGAEEDPSAEISPDENTAEETSPEESNPQEAVPESQTVPQEIVPSEPEDLYPEPQEEGELVAYDEVSRTYRLADGRYRTVIGSPGTYTDEAGNIQLIDNNLSMVTPRTRSAVSGSYVNGDNSYQVAIPTQMGEWSGITMEKDGWTIQMIPLSGDYSHSLAEGNAVRYTSVYPGVDVQYTVTDHSLKEDILLLERPNEAVSYSYRLVLPEGMRVEESPAGIFLYAPEAEEPTFYLCAPEMTDAGGEWSGQISLALSEEDGEYQLTVTPDADWLLEEGRQYPVRIDPSSVAVPSSAIGLFGMEEGSPDTIMANDWPYVGYDDGIATTNWEEFGKRNLRCRLFIDIDFDYSSLGENAKIEKATFQIAPRSNYSNGTTEIGLYTIDADWDPQTWTWNHQVDFPFTFIESQYPAGRGVYMNYDITEYVNNHVQGIATDYGLALKATDEYAQCEVMYNHNTSSTVPPQILIEWTEIDPDDTNPELANRPLEDLTINLRPITEKSVSGKLQFDGVFADGLATAGAIVAYQLSGTEVVGVAEAQGQYAYPDSSEWDAAFPEGTKYKSLDSNWQTMLFTNLQYDTVYQITAVAGKDGVSSPEVKSESFLIYQVKDFDTLPRIAAHYGVPLDTLMRDNRVQDTLLIENNTLFVRNPQTAEPYNPDDLSDDTKRDIDWALMGRGLHCEFGFEPVNLNTGNFYMNEVDAQRTDLNGMFSVERIYNSRSGARGMFGYGWSFSYDQRLGLREDGSVLWLREDGSRLVFTPNGEGAYTAPAGYDYRLTPTYAEDAEGNSYVSAWTLDAGDGSQYAFDSFGLLTSITDEKGLVTSLTYDASWNLSAITSPSGAVYAIACDGQGRITSITRPDGAVLSYGYDEAGNLSSYTNAMGDTCTYVYDESHRMTEWYDENGTRVVANQYDEEGRVISQTDANGNTASFRYGDGQTVTVDNEGRETVYTYDDQYRTTRIDYPDGTHVEKNYDGENRLVSETDVSGNTTTYTYDGNGNMTSMTRADGTTASWAYDSRSLLLSETDFAGNTTTHAYDGAGNRIRTAYPDGTSVSMEYDELGRMVSQTDGDGYTTTYGWNGACRTSETDANGNTTLYGYNGMNLCTSIENPLGETSVQVYDAAGRMVQWVDRSGASTTYEYDGTGRILSETDARGNTTAYTYDAVGNRTGIQYPDGGTESFSYNKNGETTQATDVLGNTVSYELDAMGRILSAADETGRTVSYTYDAAGNVTSVTDANGNTTTYTYDTVKNLPVSVTDAAGNTTGYTYDGNGNLTAVQYPDGTSESQSWDSRGRMASYTDALGATAEMFYDSRGNLLSSTVGEAVYAYTYDGAGDLTSVTDPLGNTITYTLDAAGRRKAETDALGRTTTYTYDGMGRILSATDGAGNTTSYAYDGNGNLTRFTDGNGAETSYTYDARNRLTSVTDGNGGITVYTYNTAGNLLEQVDPMGGITSFSYDLLGHAVSATDANGGSYAYTYDNNGNNLTITTPDGGQTVMEYNALNQLAKSTDAAGLMTSFVYDSRGNLITAEDNTGAFFTSTYDGAGNLTSGTDSLGQVTAYEYDAYGRLVTETAPDGAVTQYTYDELDRVTSVTAADGTVTSYTYDEAGQLASVTDGNGAVTQYGYDGAGRLVSETNPLGAVTQYGYDGAGNLTSVTDANGIVTSYTYDGAGNLLTVTDGSGAVTTYTYDAKGRLIGVTDATGSGTEYLYDAMDNLVKYRENGDYITEYRYDAMGNLTEEISPRGAATTYAYDAHQVLTQMTDPMGNVTSYEVDLNGQVTRMTQADGGQYAYTYDLLGRITGVTTPLGYSVAYAYDAADNLVEERDSLGRTTAYTYDALGRMLSSTNPAGGVTSYTYDGVGNVTSETDPLGRTTQYGYNLAGYLTSMTDPEGKVDSLAYDSVGNVTEILQSGGRKSTYAYDSAYNLTGVTDPMGHVTTYTYDAVGRTTSLTDPLGRTERATYDALGRLTSVTEKDGKTETYTYDAHGNVLAYTDKTGRSTQYAYDLNDNLTQVKLPGGGETFYAYDSMNRLTQYTDALGQATTYTYDAEGNLTSLTDPEGRTENYTYDVLGRMTAYTMPGGSRITYDYDQLNQLVKKSYEDAQGNAADQPVWYGYNSAGERLSMMDTTGTSEYTYDALGRLSTVTNGSGRTVTYTYDEANQLAGIDYGDGTSVFYSYDRNGNLTTVTDASGAVTTYEYDAADRLVKTLRPDGTETRVTYDALDQITLLENVCTDCGDVISTYSYTYDERGNITAETAGESLVGYLYDDKHDGKHDDKHDSLYPHGLKHNGKHDKDGTGQARYIETTRSFTYDEDGRLLTCEETDPNYGTTVYTYEYDTLGNRTLARETLEGELVSETTYTYNGSNQLTEEKTTEMVAKNKNKTEKKETTITYTYDEAGNRIQETDGETTLTYSYTAENRLKAVSDGSHILLAATYDGDGEKVFQLDYWEPEKKSNGKSEKETDSMPVIPEDASEGLTELYELATGAKGTYTITEYLNDVNRENTEVLAEYAVDGSGKTSYTYGVERLSRESAGAETETAWYLYDARGSVSALSTGEGTLLESYQYDPFGAITFGEPEEANLYAYNGESTNTATGFQYLRARHYDTGTGSFLTEDSYLGTLDNPLSRNRYAYGEGNPLKYEDPSGHSVVSALKDFAKKAYRNIKTAVKDQQNYVRNLEKADPLKAAAYKIQKNTEKSVQTARNYIKDQCLKTGDQVLQSARNAEESLTLTEEELWESGYTGTYNGNYYWYGLPVSGEVYYDNLCCQMENEYFQAVGVTMMDGVATVIGEFYKVSDELSLSNNAYVDYQLWYRDLTEPLRLNTEVYNTGLEHAPYVILLTGGILGIEAGLLGGVAGGGAAGAGAFGTASTSGMSGALALQGALSAEAVGQLAIAGVAGIAGANLLSAVAENLSGGGGNKGGSGSETVTRGKSRAPETGNPGSIYEQVDNNGNVMSRTKYGSNGRPEYRDDLTGRPHYDKSTGQYLKQHRHNFTYNENGQPTGGNVTPIPD